VDIDMERLRAWYGRNRRLVIKTGIAALLAIVAVESLLLMLQWSTSRRIASQSDKLLATFLAGDTVQTAQSRGVPMRLQNVRFKWSDKVYIDTPNLAVRAVPLEGTTVNLEDLSSFLLKVQQSEVILSPEVLEGMLNESVFNYPGSKLSDLKVKIEPGNEEHGGGHVLHLNGNVKVGFWIPFKMNARLRVDTQTNTLVMDVEHVKALGILPVGKLIKMEPLQMEHLISLPPNKSMMVRDNEIMIKPFGLFPPPRINGRISSVTVDDKVIRLTFAGDAIPAPESPDKNYVYLKGGSSQFGRFRMLETDILIVDQDPRDLFVFSLKDYQQMIPRSTIVLNELKSARVTMPDYSSAPVAANQDRKVKVEPVAARTEPPQH
jgi:hypothetical protein